MALQRLQLGLLGWAETQAVHDYHLLVATYKHAGEKGRLGRGVQAANKQEGEQRRDEAEQWRQQLVRKKRVDRVAMVLFAR